MNPDAKQYGQLARATQTQVIAKHAIEKHDERITGDLCIRVAAVAQADPQYVTCTTPDAFSFIRHADC
jgi:hypothetical protein